MKILQWVTLAAVVCAGRGVHAKPVKFSSGDVPEIPNLSDPFADGLPQVAAAAPQPSTFDYSFSINQSIPDNNPAGVVDRRDINAAGLITDIQVTLEISGGANGDYYVYLQHDDQVAILVNRVGKSDSMPDGYNEPGMNVTFSDAAANGDIHIYRVTITGNDTTALGEPLGSQLGNSLWQPDGRNVSPFDVTTDSSRTAMLSAFHDHLLAGGWTLFAADMSPGQNGVLVGWNLQVTVLPEPGTKALLFAGTLALGVFGIRRRLFRIAKTGPRRDFI